DEAVDHDLDRVLAALVERLHLLREPNLAVDAQAHEALAAQRREELAVLALAVLEHAREQREPRAVGERAELARDLLGALAAHRSLAAVAVLDSDARVEDAQVVGDLGDRADRRARVRARRLLLDRDRRREAADRVVARLLHLAEELARVGRERLDVAALALGVERVEGERGLARARDARQHDELLLRDADVDGAEV